MISAMSATRADGQEDGRARAQGSGPALTTHHRSARRSWPRIVIPRTSQVYSVYTEHGNMRAPGWNLTKPFN